MTTDSLSNAEIKFWNQYVQKAKKQIELKGCRVDAEPAGDFNCTNKLIALYRSKKKYAGSSLVKDYELSGDPLPKVGNYWIVLDQDKKPAIIVKTERTEINTFENVTKEIAIAEGEGDLSIEYWKKNHSEFWSPFLKDWGIGNINYAEVLTEFFVLVYDYNE